MPVKVIDASAVAAILFNEPDADLVIERIAGDALIAPSLMPFEVASVCRKKLTTYPRQRERLLAAFGLLDRLDIVFEPIDLAGTIALAVEARLSVYDASYLWLARARPCALVTLDRKLARAGSKGSDSIEID
jgi:predicted nucleic acid-binding protein